MSLFTLGWPPHHFFRSEEQSSLYDLLWKGDILMFIVGLGAVFFGLIVGWIAYSILRQRADAPWTQDLIALLGIIAGAAVLAFFRDDVLFGWYAVGLFIGFFASFAVGVILYGKQAVQLWLSEQVSPPSASET